MESRGIFPDRAEPNQFTRHRNLTAWGHPGISDLYIYIGTTDIIPPGMARKGRTVYCFPVPVNKYLHPDIYIIRLKRIEIAVIKFPCVIGVYGGNFIASIKVGPEMWPKANIRV